MSSLLDTHRWSGGWRSPSACLDGLTIASRTRGARLFVSAASVYEIEYKRERDELLDLPNIVPMLGFRWLSVDADDAFEAAKLGDQHRDPWDRIIAAQARRRDFDLITADETLTRACLEWQASTLW